MNMKSGPIVVLGAFDSKGAEYKFLVDAIVREGARTATVNFGILGSTDRFRVDVDAEKFARAGGGDLTLLRSQADRGAAMKTMAAGAAAVARKLYEDGKLAGIIGMGGSGGTSVITAAMRALPTGVPKICVTTVAGGDVHAYVGTKDFTLIPSVVDVAGLNRISQMIFTRAAGAIVGMVHRSLPWRSDCHTGRRSIRFDSNTRHTRLLWCFVDGAASPGARNHRPSAPIQKAFGFSNDPKGDNVMEVSRRTFVVGSAATLVALSARRATADAN